MQLTPQAVSLKLRKGKVFHIQFSTRTIIAEKFLMHVFDIAMSKQRFICVQIKFLSNRSASKV